jgi:hypothetical protein
MRVAVCLLLGACAALALYKRIAGESMHKPKPRSAEQMSYGWRVEHAYDRDGDAA